MASPWMKFYPQDWRADEKLRLCSLAARGLWIEMLAIMHRSERYGQLLIGGRVPTDAQLAVQVGASPDQVPILMAELEEAGVFSRATSGAIYSRRMTRDHKKAETARKNGKKGGNPSLGNKTGKSGWDNQQDNPPDKGGVKPQKPEARGQSVSSSKEKETPKSRKRAMAGVPDWVPAEPWAGFFAMRERIKKPLTERAITMAVNKLAELQREGEDVAAVLDQSTLKCWQDLYPVKREAVASGGEIW